MAKPGRYGPLTGVRLPRSDSLPLQLTDLQRRLAPTPVVLQHKLDLFGIFQPQLAPIVTVAVVTLRKSRACERRLAKENFG